MFNRNFRLISVLLLSFCAACGGGDNGGGGTIPQPTDVRITQVTLSYGSNNLDPISINESGKGTVAITGTIPGKVTLKSIKLSDNTEVEKNEELTLTANKVTFSHETKSYEVDFTKTGSGITGTEAEITSMKVTIGSGKPSNVFFNPQKIAKFSISESVLPEDVVISTFVLSQNATSNHKLNDNLNVTTATLSFSITVSSGDGTVNNTFTLDFSLQTSTSKNILVFAFLPENGNEDADESNTSKKGLNRKYFGVITAGEENKIDIHIPSSTKDKLRPSIIHTGKSISPQNEAATSFTNGFPIPYTLTDASGETEVYKIYVYRSLLDAEIKIKSALIGTTSLSINALESQEILGVETGADFKFTFSHNIDPSAIDLSDESSSIDIVKVSDGTKTPVTLEDFDGDAKNLKIHPQFRFDSNTSYQLILKNTLTSVIDDVTYPLEKTYTIRFKTK